MVEFRHQIMHFSKNACAVKREIKNMGNDQYY